MGDEPALGSIRAPLMGTYLTPVTAGALAHELDGLPTLHYPLLSLGSGEEAASNSGLLGVGGSARIYKGRYDGRQVAVKLLFCMELTPSDVTSFASEANKMHQLRNHSNMIKLLGVCVRPPSLALVMEFAQYGSLYSVLHPPSMTRPPKKVVNDTAQQPPQSLSSSNMSLTNTIPSISSSSINNNINNGSSNASSSGGDMDGVTMPTIRLTLRNRLLISMMCARGVAFMHSQRPPILHLDLKVHLIMHS
jgi:serine/threonine protein kinase